LTVSENKYFLFVSFNNFSVSFSPFIFRSFGCVLNLCRGTSDHDFCAVNKQLYRGDSHPLAISFNTLFLCHFCFDLLFMCCNNRVVSRPCGICGEQRVMETVFFPITWVFPCQYYSIIAPYTLFHQLSLLYNLINWQRCWITHIKNIRTQQCLLGCPHTLWSVIL
jgi:hypothetical protein